jgi:hypothetical protein
MNKPKQPSIVPLLILTLITVVMWVSLEVYRIFTKPVSLVVSEEISQPLTPTLDQEAINQIVSKIYLDDSQIPDGTVTSSPLPGQKSVTLPISQPESASESGTAQ